MSVINPLATNTTIKILALVTKSEITFYMITNFDRQNSILCNFVTEPPIPLC